MRRLGVELRLYSWHGGGHQFDGLPVARFSKWRLLTLFWIVFREWARHPAEAAEMTRRLFLSAPRDWMNQWENLYGAGIAAVIADEFRRAPVDHIHAVWASLPATVAWVLSRFTGIPFSIGAHAYDVYEHGGDWFLREKCAAAVFVHTSTAAAQRQLVRAGVDPGRILLVRRGLDALPLCRPLRSQRTPLRIVCVARLVEKKGLLRQLLIYRACRDAGLAFTVRIIGEGPLRARLEAGIRAARLHERVALVGHVSLDAVWRELAEADVLVHTGVVAASGDRDGLPNVVPEAMAAGVIVFAAPGEGVEEAVAHGHTGFVCALGDPAAWLEVARRVQTDEARTDQVRRAARRWVEENFDAEKNAAKILERMRAGRP